MEDLAVLNEQFSRKNRKARSKKLCGMSETSKAAPLAGVELSLEKIESLTFDYRRKGLWVSVYGSDGHGRAGHKSVRREIADQGMRDKWQIDGKEDCETGRCRPESSAYSRQWALTGVAGMVFNDRRERRERTSSASNFRLQSGSAQDGQRVSDQGFAGKSEKGFVLAHTTGFAAGQDKSCHLNTAVRVRQAQLPASSRKRISDWIPSSKFFRLNFSFGA